MTRIVLFSDPHYTPGLLAEGVRDCSAALDRLRILREQTADCDLYINLGDSINGTGTSEVDQTVYRDYMRFWEGCPVVHLPGNHDAYYLAPALLDGFCPEPGMGCSRAFDRGGVRFLALDANFHKDGRPYGGIPGDWTDSALPAKQLAWLEKQLASCESAVILIHQNLDDRAWGKDGHVVQNAAQVRQVLEQSGKVRAVFQGHYHKGLTQVLNGIPYYTLPALCECVSTRTQEGPGICYYLLSYEEPWAMDLRFYRS